MPKRPFDFHQQRPTTGKHHLKAGTTNSPLKDFAAEVNVRKTFIFTLVLILFKSKKQLPHPIGCLEQKSVYSLSLQGTERVE